MPSRRSTESSASTTRTAAAAPEAAACDVLDDGLEHGLRLVEVLQRPLAQVAHRDAGRQVVGDHGPRRGGHEDLAARAGLAQARRQVHADAVVALLGPARLAGVQRHPRPHDGVAGPAVARHRALRSDRRRHPVPGACERDEAAVAARVDLVAAVPRDDSAQEPAMLVQDLAVAVAHLADE